MKPNETWNFRTAQTYVHNSCTHCSTEQIWLSSL